MKLVAYISTQYNMPYNNIPTTIQNEGWPHSLLYIISEEWRMDPHIHKHEEEKLIMTLAPRMPCPGSQSHHSK